MRAVCSVKESTDFLNTEDHRQSMRCTRTTDLLHPRQLGVEDVLVKKEQGGQCLLVRRC